MKKGKTFNNIYKAANSGYPLGNHCRISTALYSHSQIYYKHNIQNNIDHCGNDQELNLKLDNFYDEAYIMIRMNEGTPGNIEGGELTHITGNLYLLRAKDKSVKIEIR